MTKIADLPFDVAIGNRASAALAVPTLIFNPKNDRLFFDEDGIGGAKAIKVGKIDNSGDLSLSEALAADVVFGDRRSNLSDEPTLILNLKNGKILFDADGAGGAAATRIGFVDLDLIV